MSLIDTAAIRREVDAKDAARTPPVRQWDKLPIGTVFISPSGVSRQIVCELYKPDGTETEGPDEPYYVTCRVDKDDGRPLNVLLSALENCDPDWPWSISPESYADAYRRDDLAKAGFFSVDDPAHRARRRDQAFEEAKRHAAAAALGIDRDGLLDKVAAALAPRTPEGIWPKSTAAYAKRREALDNAILYAAGVIDHA